MTDADEKVYIAETIQDTPLPGEVVSAPVSESTSANAQVYTQAKISEQNIPTKRIATDVIGARINTQAGKIINEFQFEPHGAIQVGNYQQGVNGDIRISPAGIAARNSLGQNTFVLNGETGDATFMGTIQSGALVAGVVAVGDDTIQIDGESKRILQYDEEGIPWSIWGVVS